MRFIFRALADIMNGLTILGGIIATFLLITSLATGSTNTITFAIALVVIPYCVGGACSRDLEMAERYAKK